MLAVPFIVRAVSPEVYGTFATLSITTWIVFSIGDLGIGTAVLRVAPERETDARRKALFGTMISTRAVIGTLLCGLVMAMNGPLSRWLTGTSGNGPALIWLALFAPFAMIFEGFADEMRSRGAMVKLSALLVLWSASIQALSVVFVTRVHLDLMGLVWARALGEVLTCSAAAVLCFRYVRGRPNLADLKGVLALGWPIGAMYVLGTLRGLDRPLIRTMTSLDHVAAYELALKLVGPIGLSNIALAKVLEPVVYGFARSRNTPRYVDAFLRGYIAIFAVVAMALSVTGPEILGILVPRSYHGAIRALPPLAFLATCEGLGRIVGIGADLMKRMRVWAAAAIVVLAVGFPLSAVLVRVMGESGVGLAWVVANAAGNVVLYAVARRLSGIVLPMRRSLALVLVGTGLGTAAAWQPLPIVARLALLVAYAVAVVRVMGVHPRDLLDLLRSISSPERTVSDS